MVTSVVVVAATVDVVVVVIAATISGVIHKCWICCSCVTLMFQTLVLAKITPRTLRNTTSPDKNIAMPEVNPDPLSSNIYNVGERIVLSWLNHHYEHYRQKIWGNCNKGRYI